jgi:hypothetical protein
MGLDQYLYKVTTEELEKLRELLKENEDAIYGKPGLLYLWEERNNKNSYYWRKRWDISETICSLETKMEYDDIRSFQEGFTYFDTDWEDEEAVEKKMPSLEGTGFYYVYIESY